MFGEAGGSLSLIPADAELLDIFHFAHLATFVWAHGYALATTRAFFDNDRFRADGTGCTGRAGHQTVAAAAAFAYNNGDLHGCSSEEAGRRQGRPALAF